MEPEKLDESPDESLAAVPPTPIESTRAEQAGGLALGAILLTAAGAGALLLIGGTMTPAVGATRSAKLEWEQRKLQIEQAERDAQVDHQLDDEADAQPKAAE
jgi:hypothetical protein